MEGLILVVVGLFTELVAMLGAAIFGALSIVLAPLSFLIPGKFKKSSPKQEVSTSPSRAKISASPKFRKIMTIFTCLCGVILIVLIIVNAFFFEPLSKKILTNALSKNGATFECNKIRGSLFSGRFEVDQLDVKSPNWSISVDELKVDVAVLDLITGSRTVEDLKLKGFVGSATLPQKKDSLFSLGKLKPPPKRPKKRKDFRIIQLDISDVEMSLAYENGKLPPVHSIKIESMECVDFRSRAALFYLFFRSNTSAELNGRPLSVSVQDRLPRGKTTKWQADRIPLAGLRGHGAIFDFMESGWVSLDVSDDWVQSDHLEADLDWKLTFFDVKTKDPDEMLLGKSISKFVNDSPNPFEISFRLKLDPETFEGSASETAELFYSEISKGVITAFFEITGQKVEGVEEKAKKGIDLLKGVFDKARKK